jgi:hypothetical protein
MDPVAGSRSGTETFPFLEGWSAAIVPFFTTLSRLVDVEFEDDRKGMN